jgi:glycosyltransferase involved in cell wall biosynthesis
MTRSREAWLYFLCSISICFAVFRGGITLIVARAQRFVLVSATARSPIILIQDADLEYDPAEYERMLRPIIDGRADVVFGSRFIGSEAHRVLYFWHSVANRFLTLLSNMATNLNLSDMATGFKAFRRELIQQIKLEEDRFGFEPEILPRSRGLAFQFTRSAFLTADALMRREKKSPGVMG